MNILIQDLPPIKKHAEVKKSKYKTCHRDLLEKLGVKVSMSKNASPWQNPYQESFYSQFKLEMGSINRFENNGQLAKAIYR